MIRWILFLFIAEITLFADNTLYDELKKNDILQNGQKYRSDIFVPPSPAFAESGEFHLTEDAEGKDYLPQYINVNDKLPDRYKNLIGDSVSLQFLMISTIGILAIMPDSITNWNSEKLKERSLGERWKENVTTTPVWDNDNWMINYIGHPVSGAFYYTLARNDGMSISESAAFSALMSTFFWEYGYESFAEVPSIQDLIFTPLLGSILGEQMFTLQKKLDQEGGVVLGSKTLGDMSYFILDPLGNIANGIGNTLKRFNFDADVTMSIQTYPQAKFLHQYPDTPTEDSLRFKEREYGFIITIQ
ncbi:MAG: DUF3943 domain-containing protein [Sulfuricurvum sp.]|uniref:DUF3943 domain-containing protein n=1 Tax=Sulfuricurvum sp. TaxID=2025608 RepID=UPI00261BBC77|nr:DUF3943 domain-containing protein [Sulfuricurvum sp.]MDD2369610.1 DUF3943 domain-containing protein [Sulfuricurvum sp.]MDD5117077.1 DUF3943 domain-containing protein [Sulfuricurvum sp.]